MEKKTLFALKIVEIEVESIYYTGSNIYGYIYGKYLYFFSSSGGAHLAGTISVVFTYNLKKKDTMVHY